MLARLFGPPLLRQCFHGRRATQSIMRIAFIPCSLIRSDQPSTLHPIATFRTGSSHADCGSLLIRAWRVAFRSKPCAYPRAQEVTALKDEGKEAFGKREYVKALEAYDKALRALPEGNSDVPLMHSNKAACNMMLKRCRSSSQLLRAVRSQAPAAPRPLIFA